MSIKKLFAVLFAVCAVLFSSSAVCAEPVTEDYSLQSSEEAVTVFNRGCNDVLSL